MADRNEIVEYTNDFLNLHSFRDYGPMGLQFAGNEKVERIATGVSVSLELIERAASLDADTLLVHHGLFWNNEPRRIDERMQGRLDALEEANINLLAYHLPLDAHPHLGNNICALADFDGTIRKFGDIGWGKKLTRPFKREWLRSYYQSEGYEPIIYEEGPTQIRKVAAIVGGAPFYIHDAVREGYDLFITGEAAEPSAALARELGINFVALGHYNSEKCGVRYLGDHLAHEFDVKSFFIDIPNSV